MKKLSLLSSAMLMIVLIITGCKSLSFTQKTLPAEIPVQDYSKSIVVIDAGDVYTPGLAITKKREAVVTSIKNMYFSNLPDVLRKDLQLPAFRDTILTDDEKTRLLQNDDAVRLKLATKYGANIFIILQNYEGGFSQDEVVRTKNNDGGTDTAFKFASQNGVEAFYWRDGPFGYALVADLPRDQLMPLAEAVYHQIAE